MYYEKMSSANIVKVVKTFLRVAQILNDLETDLEQYLHKQKGRKWQEVFTNYKQMENGPS